MRLTNVHSKIKITKSSVGDKDAHQAEIITKVGPTHMCALKELQMTLQTSDVNSCNGNMKYPIGASTFHTKFCVQALPCFYWYC